jgi:stearoyl-CoA desaturase (delta-9 desaturase)
MQQATDKPKPRVRFVARPSASRTTLALPALVWYPTTYAVALAFGYRFASVHTVILFYVLQFIFGCSITLGAHRYFAHRSFVAKPWLRSAIAIAYTLSFNRCGEGLISWCAGHKFHHAYTDQALDPHSPRHGFWHAFCGHFIWRRRDLWDLEEARHYRPDLAAEPLLVWLEQNIIPLQLVWAAVLFGLGYAIGGLPEACAFIVWGIFVRLAYSQLVASFVDTFSHGALGFRRLPDVWDTGTSAKNNFLYWNLTIGNETWHNTHHAFPRSVRNGYRWYHWDLDSLLIHLAAKLGLATELQHARELQTQTQEASP